MADTKISALPAATAVNATDLFAKVNDPAGTPVTQRATGAQLATFLGGSFINRTGDSGMSGTFNFGVGPKISLFSSNGAANFAATKIQLDATGGVLFANGAGAGADAFAIDGDTGNTFIGSHVTFTASTGKLEIIPAANTSAFVVSGFSLTGANAQSLIDLAGTWNTSGTPTALKLNITSTASNASSLLCDFQTGSASKFKVRKDGATTIQGISNSVALSLSSTHTGANESSCLSVTPTWNTSESPSAIQVNVTNTDSDTDASFLDCRIGGGQICHIRKDGTFLSDGGISLGTGNFTVATDGSFSAANSNFTVGSGGQVTGQAGLSVVTDLSAVGGLFTVDAGTANVNMGTTLSFAPSGKTVSDDGTNLVLTSPCLVGSAPFYDASTNFGVNSLQINNGVVLTDDGGNLVISQTLQFGVAAVAETPTATHTIVVKDSGGTVYRVLVAEV